MVMNSPVEHRRNIATRRAQSTAKRRRFPSMGEYTCALSGNYAPLGDVKRLPKVSQRRIRKHFGLSRKTAEHCLEQRDPVLDVFLCIASTRESSFYVIHK